MPYAGKNFITEVIKSLFPCPLLLSPLDHAYSVKRWQHDRQLHAGIILDRSWQWTGGRGVSCLCFHVIHLCDKSFKVVIYLDGIEGFPSCGELLHTLQKICQDFQAFFLTL